MTGSGHWSSRVAHQDELDDALAEWTQRLTPWEAATALQEVGVAASPVLDNWAVLTDPQLEAREFFRVLPHARFGGELSFGQAMVLSATPARFERAAPGFGEHTREVLADLAGLDDDAIQAAIDAGVAHQMGQPEAHLERPYLHWIPHLMPLPWPPSQIDPAQILYERLAREQTAGPGSDPGERG